MVTGGGVLCLFFSVCVLFVRVFVCDLLWARARARGWLWVY